LSEQERAKLASLGARIAAAREARGWTIAELAARATVDASFAGELERGRANPSIRTVIRLADALGVALPELFDF
jgi:transcriptional regulator with XRE-family HTH domain